MEVEGCVCVSVSVCDSAVLLKVHNCYGKVKLTTEGFQGLFYDILLFVGRSYLCSPVRV